MDAHGQLTILTRILAFPNLSRRIPEFYGWECSVMARRARGSVMMMVDAVKSTGRFVGLDAFVPLAVAVGTI